jgi:hypothetical protein
MSIISFYNLRIQNLLQDKGSFQDFLQAKSVYLEAFLLYF